MTHAKAHSSGFSSAFKAEARKGRGGAARKIALIAPLPFCALGIVSSGVIEGTGAIGGISTCLWNYWYALMMPVAIALMCVSIANLDARQKLRPVLGLPLPPQRTWWAKIGCGLVLSLGANLVVLVASTALTLAGAEGPTFVQGLAAVLILTAASSWMIPTSLALATRAGSLAGIALPALVQIGVGIAFWTSETWWAFPPATTLCAVAPFTGAAPSGVPLEAGDALGVFGWQAAAGLSLAVGLFVVLAVAGARWYARREAV